MQEQTVIESKSTKSPQWKHNLLGGENGEVKAFQKRIRILERLGEAKDLVFAFI